MKKITFQYRTSQHSTAWALRETFDDPESFDRSDAREIIARTYGDAIQIQIGGAWYLDGDGHDVTMWGLRIADL
jgi:hypothetical protein